jgi:hypothetical protein
MDAQSLHEDEREIFAELSRHPQSGRSLAAALRTNEHEILGPLAGLESARLIVTASAFYGTTGPRDGGDVQPRLTAEGLRVAAELVGGAG